MFEATHEELAVAAAADLSACAVPQLGEEIRELYAIELAARAQRLRRVEAHDRSDGPADDGHLSSTGWLKSTLGLPHSEAAAEVGVARVRRTLPGLAACYEAGRTSFRHLRITAAAMRRLPQPEIWTELDLVLVDWAQKHPAKAYAEMLDVLVDQLGPEPKSKDEAQHAQRRLSIHTGFDGMVNLSGRLTPEVAEKLIAALSAASRPDADGEIRSVGQRKADALEHLTDTTLDNGLLPHDGGEKPHLTVTVDLDRLGEQSPAPDPDGARRFGETPDEHERRLTVATAAAEAVSSQPQFYWTGPAAPGVARRIACDATVLPLYTRNGRPLDVGQRTRVVSSALRAFILARDYCCQAPGCDVPGRWTHVHHVKHWADGGPTTRANLVLLCPKHHREAHSGRWVVVLHAPGSISFRRRLPGEELYEIRCPLGADAPDPDLASTLPLDGMLAAAAHRLRAG